MPEAPARLSWKLSTAPVSTPMPAIGALDRLRRRLAKPDDQMIR